MIINTALKEKFSRRVNYNHDVEVYERTAQTDRFQEQFRKSFRVRSVSSLPTSTRSPANLKNEIFNRYYIKPELQYRIRSQDPKSNPETLKDETHVYKNLHNVQFVNWAHPLQRNRLFVSTAEKKSIIKEDRIEKLQNFKKFAESRGMRLPLIVKDVLEGKI